MRNHHSSAYRKSLTSLLAALVAACALSASASAASPTKPYEVALSPARVPAGVTVDAFAVKLTNRTGTQQLGSADVTVPAAITVVGAPTLDRAGTVSASGNVLALRNLALPPDASVTVTVALRMPCVADAYTWSVAAKQSNDFKGPPGNSLGPVIGSLTTTVTGSCGLRFVAQPAVTEKNEAIRAEAFAPSSDQLVTVEAVDGSSSPARLTWFTGPSQYHPRSDKLPRPAGRRRNVGHGERRPRLLPEPAHRRLRHLQPARHHHHCGARRR